MPLPGVLEKYKSRPPLAIGQGFTMESTIAFERIIDAFIHSEGDDYFFLSERDLVKKIAATKDSVQQMARDGFACLPHRSKDFENKMREAFVYEIADQKLAEEIFEAAVHNDGAVFEKAVREKGLSEKWESHKRVFLGHALVNWLVRSNINLPGQVLIPKIEVSEVDAKAVPDEMAALIPISCIKCGNASGFLVRYFKASASCDNLLMEREAERQMREYGFESFMFLGKAKKELIAASKCPKCGSSETNWDFK